MVGILLENLNHDDRVTSVHFCSDTAHTDLQVVSTDTKSSRSSSDISVEI